MLLTECTFAKDSVSGLHCQACMLGQVHDFGLIPTECTYAKDSVSGLLFQVCMFGKARTHGLPNKVWQSQLPRTYDAPSHHAGVASRRCPQQAF